MVWGFKIAISISNLDEMEMWRSQVVGLQALHWTVDDVCQLLVSIGLDKYVPEFTINKINGAKLLDLDGSKLKVCIINPTITEKLKLLLRSFILFSI